MVELFGALVQAAARLGECLMAPAKNQFSYLYHYEQNITSLKDQMRILENTVRALHLSVDAAKRNLEVIGPDVEDWLRRADELKVKVEEIDLCDCNTQKGCVHGGCLNLKSRYLLGKKAKKMIKAVIELHSTSAFTRISYPPPIMPDSTHSGSLNEFDSRKSVERSILSALEDDNVNIVGLCGMGGVGKTMMVENIAKRIKEKGLFDEVVLAVVTQQPDLKMLQGEIAGELGLNLKEDSLRARANRVLARIKNVKKILMILDDVWTFLNLENLGIPLRSDHSGCKILLTSRLRDVCTAMEAQKTLTVEVLSKEEAWVLFKGKAGDMVNSPDICPIAKEVADECKGLPIALVTVARALKGKSRPVWEDAVKQLKESIPENLTGLRTNVYQQLELSYNHLDSKEAKSLFLLCCLFQEGFNIYIKDLAAYGMGLGIFARVETVNEAQNRVHTLVDILKDRFLLLQGRDKVHVKMHDVVRDVAIAIASHAFWISHDVNLQQWPFKQSSECVRCISLTLNADIEVPTRLNCPNLEFFHCQSNDPGQTMPEGFFEGLNTLRAVEINEMNFPSLPSSLQSLENLQVMILSSCKLENVSMIGKLVNLTILSLHGCNVRELPAEVGGLTELRLLDVRMCRNLHVIAPGVLSRLVQLEELHMTRSFEAWEIDEEGIERRNAALTELESLSNLTTLKIQIPSQYAICRNMSLSSKLTTFYICIGPKRRRLDNYFQRSMDLSLPTLASLGDWIHVMLRSSECLRLEGEGTESAVNELIRNGFQQVKGLHMENCPSVLYLADNDTVGNVSSNSGIFPILESLELIDLSGLEVICRGTLSEGSFNRLRKLKFGRLQRLKQLWTGSASPCFANLKSISIFQCHNLPYLFPLSTARSLVQLERLVIVECQVIEEVFTKESGERGIVPNKIELPKLSNLMLEKLPCLTNFCKGFDNFEFPELESLQILRLPKLEGFHYKKKG